LVVEDSSEQLQSMDYQVSAIQSWYMYCTLYLQPVLGSSTLCWQCLSIMGYL